MQGAIFDMDGLLVDTERLYQQVWRELAAERGLTLPPSFPAEITGKGEHEALEIVCRHFHVEDARSIEEECKRRVTALEENGVEPKPGAREILDGLRARGFRLAVASSSPEEMVRHNLASCGLIGFFDELVSGGEVPPGRGKPHPDIFLLAAAFLKLPPEQCYVFEDSINGIRAGVQAGCRCVMIPDQVQPDDDVRRICEVYPDLSLAWAAISARLEETAREE